MPRQASRLTSDRAAQPAARPAWRLPEPVPKAGPPGPIWKFLLAAAILVQVAWIVALIVMATR